ncbi:MAG: hypothetical protein M1830_000193 [Pleopsidium flavum]|nr:MAG: hypothetical protein M1830_000193 [Pleopsidium flavum]
MHLDSLQKSSSGERETIGIINGQQVKFTYNVQSHGKLLWHVVDKQEESALHSGKVIAVIKGDGFNEAKLQVSEPVCDGDPYYTIFYMGTAQSPSGDRDSKFWFNSTKASGLPTAFLDKHLVPACPAHFSPGRSQDKMLKVHVIISTLSGTGLAQAFFEDLVEPTLSAFGLSRKAYQVHETQSDQSVTELTRSVFLPCANKGTAQTILLLSGDGGMVDMINALLSTRTSTDYIKPTVGLLALGTGNALAYSINPPQDSTFGLANVVRGTPHPLPTFSVRFSPGSVQLFDESRRSESVPRAHMGDDDAGVMYGAVVCSWALHASLVADSDTSEYRKYGTERFQKVAKELLSPSDGSPTHKYKGKVSLIKRTSGGKAVWESLDGREHMYILATLVSNLEKVLTISPSTKPLDGQLRLVHFRPMLGDEAMRILGKAYKGGLHVEEDAVGYEDIDGLLINFEEDDSRWRRVCVDGKIIRVNQGGWVEMRREPRDVVDVIAAC